MEAGLEPVRIPSPLGNLEVGQNTVKKIMELVIQGLKIGRKCARCNSPNTGTGLKRYEF